MRRKMLDEIAQEAVADGVYDVIPPAVDLGLDRSPTRNESKFPMSQSRDMGHPAATGPQRRNNHAN
jgi:hypothetical protein